MPDRFEAVERGASIYATMVQVDPATRKAGSLKAGGGFYTVWAGLCRSCR